MIQGKIYWKLSCCGAPLTFPTSCTWLQFVISAAVIEHKWVWPHIQTAAEVLFLLDYMQSAEELSLNDISIDQLESDTHEPCLQAK